MKTKKIVSLILVIIMLVGCICSCDAKVPADDTSSQNTEAGNPDAASEADSTEAEAGKTDSEVSLLSFNAMKSRKDLLNEQDEMVIRYFDTDHFYYMNYIAENYPQVFTGMKICCQDIMVLKILKSTEEEYQAVVAFVGGGTFDGLEKSDMPKIVETIPSGNVFILSGKQLEKRLSGGMFISFYGIYNGFENYTIDGHDYVLSSVYAEEVAYSAPTARYIYNRFTYKDVKAIAEIIFGKDIKVSEHTKEYSAETYYLITLDNQSNSNFKAFRMYPTGRRIEYDAEQNSLPENVSKQLYVAADFCHFFVTTYDKNSKSVYLEYFDKDYQKLWSREFTRNFVETELNRYIEDWKNNYISLDYTSELLAVSVDTDLYYIDISTGEDRISPMIVGEKCNLVMMDDGVILFGRSSKDAIMKLDYSGQIVFRNDISLPANENVKDTQIADSLIQIRDGKLYSQLVVCDWSEMMGPSSTYKFISVTQDGELDLETEKLAVGYN